MLTETYLKDHFVDAYFIDNERTKYRNITNNEDKTKVFPTIIELMKKHDMYKNYLQ